MMILIENIVFRKHRFVAGKYGNKKSSMNKKWWMVAWTLVFDDISTHAHKILLS